MCKWISIRVRDEEKVWNELVHCIEGTFSQWGKIMQYAYDLHVIVYKTFQGCHQHLITYLESI